MMRRFDMNPAPFEEKLFNPLQSDRRVLSVFYGIVEFSPIALTPMANLATRKLRTIPELGKHSDDPVRNRSKKSEACRIILASWI